MTTGAPATDLRSWSEHEHYVFRVLASLQHGPERTVLFWKDQAIGGGQLRAAIVATAATFRRLEVGAGDTVAVLTEANHPAMLVVRYAAHLLGAAAVYVRSHNPRSDALMLPESTQARILRETGSRILVTDATHVDRARAVAGQLSGTVRLVGYGVRGAGVTEIARSAKPPTFAPYRPADPAMVTFTSGSTGQPKSIVQSYRTWNNIVRSFPVPTEGLPGPPTILAVTPMSHTVGPMIDAVLAAGGRVVLHERFDADKVLRAVAEHRVTDTYLAVPHLYRLVDHPGVAEADLSSLRRVIYSGSPAAPRRIAQAFAVFGDALAQLYGSTEAGGITSLGALDHYEPELLPTVGRPLPGVRVQIRDQVTGMEVPRGQTGEVWVASPSLMDGYLGDPGLTAQVLRDGWLRTGDLGYWDQYGYLRLTGRANDVVKTGGLKIYPAAVEQALLTHPDVRAAAVFGVADADRVEHVHAAVSLRRGAACTVDDLREHVRSTLSPEHAPAVVSLWDELPLNDSGKPDTAYLRALAHEEKTGGAGDGQRPPAALPGGRT